jgi:hypothetical protein
LGFPRFQPSAVKIRDQFPNQPLRLEIRHLIQKSTIYGIKIQRNNQKKPKEIGKNQKKSEKNKKK